MEGELNLSRWSTNTSSLESEADHQDLEENMELCASRSHLMKRRRRCGGIFKPVEDARDPHTIRYGWPQRVNSLSPGVNTQAHDASSFLGSTTASAGDYSGSTVLLERMASSRHDILEHLFGQNVEGVSMEEAPLRNLATQAGRSTRSLSMYSQWSEVVCSEEHVGLGAESEADQSGNHDLLISNNNRRCMDHRTLLSPGSSTEPDFVATPSYETIIAWKSEAAKGDAKSTSTITSRIGSIRKVSNELRARTVSLTHAVIDKFDDLKIKSKTRWNSRRARQTSDGSAGSRGVGRENAEHGPRDILSDGLQAADNQQSQNDDANRRFFRLAKRKSGGCVRRVF